MNKEIKTFYIIRNHDESNISGTGKVLNGVVFPDGVTVIRWCSKNKNASPSTAIYDSFEDFKYYHIDCHPTNETEIVFNPKNI